MIDDVVRNANDAGAFDSSMLNTVPVRLNVTLDGQTELQQIETELGVKSTVNNAWNAATGSTPSFLNHGSHPLNPVSSEVYCVLPGARSFEERVNEAIARARNCRQAAAERMNRNADAKRREIQLEIGDPVLLSTGHLELAVAGATRFKPRFVGPIQVITKNGAVTYKLKLPGTMDKRHPGIPVSLSRPYNDGGRVHLVPPPAVVVDDEFEYFVQKIISHSDLANDRTEYLVKWLDMDLRRIHGWQDLQSRTLLHRIIILMD